MDKKNLILVIAAVVVVALVGVYVLYGSGSTTDTVKTKIAIRFYDAPASINPGNVTTWNNGAIVSVFPSTDNYTVYVFENVTSQSNCYAQLVAALSMAHLSFDSENQSMGTIVTAIDGDSNLEHSGRAWQYFVDDVYANRACNYVSIANEDVVEWRYITNQFSG